MSSGDHVRAASHSPGTFTYGDLLGFPDDGRRHEILDGEHFVTPSPDTRHQTVSMNLTRAFVLYLQHHRHGCLFAAPFDVVLSDRDVVQPDLLYLSNERAGTLLTDKHVRGAPDLVVEILSAGTRRTDESIKRKLYERFGVVEYWVVDPELETVKVCRRADGLFVRVADLTAESRDVLATPVLPDFAVPLSDVFAFAP